MPESAEISHKGTVKSIAGNTAIVEIMVSSACATCKATSFCALPFVVVMIGLFVLIGIGINEGIAALVSLVMLTIYYVVLYLLRDKIKKGFNFKIEKI